LLRHIKAIPELKGSTLQGRHQWQQQHTARGRWSQTHQWQSATVAARWQCLCDCSAVTVW